MSRRGREECEGLDERRIGISGREMEGKVFLRWDTGSVS